MNSPAMGSDVPSSLLRLRVLVIEDSWNVANAIKAMLEKAGASVLGPVPSVGAALAIIRNEVVSVALVDMNLRESFADDVITELVSRRIPYVIVTAYETLPTNADQHAAGVVRKPVDPIELINLVGRFVAG
jgi:DNA-binding NtrC family response regulator